MLICREVGGFALSRDGRVVVYVLVHNAGGSKYKAGDIVEADELVDSQGRS